MGDKANRRMTPSALLTGQKEVRLMWSSSAILALNETRINIATVNVILTPTFVMSMLLTWVYESINTINQSG